MKLKSVFHDAIYFADDQAIFQIMELKLTKLYKQFHVSSSTGNIINY
jgi:hypothetical protein